MKIQSALASLICFIGSASGAWISYIVVRNTNELDSVKQNTTPALTDAYITGSLKEAEYDVWRKVIQIEVQELNENTHEATFMTATLLATCFSQLGRIAEAQGKSDTARILFDKAIFYAEKGGIANDLRVHFSTNHEICYFLSDSVDKILKPRWRKEAGLTTFLEFKSP